MLACYMFSISLRNPWEYSCQERTAVLHWYGISAETVLSSCNRPAAFKKEVWRGVNPPFSSGEAWSWRSLLNGD